MRFPLCALWLLAGSVLAPLGCERASAQERVNQVIQARPIDQRLFDAIRKSDAKEVKRLLEKGANPRATEANDWPAIVVAAGESLKIVELLLAKGANINARQADQGWTPLTQAISSHQTDVVLYLLAHGADPSLPMIDGLTPLHMAVRFGDARTVKALLKQGVNVNARTTQDPNSDHSRENDEMVRDSFEPGYRDSGHTPLFELVANWREHQDIARLLLDSGADPKAVDDNGWTLLHQAAKLGSVFTVDQLLKLGLDPNARSRQEFTPLHLATRAGFGLPVVPLISRLLAAGADPSARNRQEQTPEGILRADAARLLASTNLSPRASAGSPQMRHALQALNDGLQALYPGAEPIGFPEVPMVDGWSVYPPIELFLSADESEGKIERKVRSESGRSLLSLTYQAGRSEPPSVSVDELELNAYEPLETMPLVLQANKERVVAFPAEAGPLGGSIRLKYSYTHANGSGSGELGDSYGIPNPVFSQMDTPKGREIATYCDEIWRPLEFRIDKLSVGGKELTEYRGKSILIRPSSGEPSPVTGTSKGATPLVTIKKGPKGFPTVSIRYSFRLVGNKRWRTESIEL